MAVWNALVGKGFYVANRVEIYALERTFGRVLDPGLGD
jgi:hypothetical protein